MRISLPGIYFHIPFCKKRCHYCDFVSYVVNDEEIDLYFNVLEKEMVIQAGQSHIRNIRFDSIYIGGGTPSLVPARFLCSLLDRVFELFYMEKCPRLEVSMECNPDSLNLEMLLALKGKGLNRVSLGAQSMNERELEILGRVHGTSQILSAVQYIKRAGIENFGMDIIYAIPGQDENTLAQGLERLIALSPAHLSCYELCLEKGTSLEARVARGEIEYPPQETRLALTRTVEDVMALYGYQQYEISNFSKPGFECRHNCGYWMGVEYLGLGCSACSFLADKRMRNEPDLKRYMDSLDKGELPVSATEELAPEERFREGVVMALRMNQGISTEEFYNKYGIDVLEYYGGLIPDMIEKGLLKFHEDGSRLALTRTGRYISNYVLSYFV